MRVCHFGGDLGKTIFDGESSKRQSCTADVLVFLSLCPKSPIFRDCCSVDVGLGDFRPEAATDDRT